MPGARPNVVVILADDLGYGDLGCFGNPAVHTPAIDRLAAEGVRLTQHYSGSAVCAPARACLLTGRYPHRTGAIDLDWIRGDDRLATRETTLADVLSAAGYATGLVGKWHLGSFDPRYHPNRRGFREFIGFHFGMSDYYTWTLDRSGTPFPADGRYLTDVFTDEAVDFVRRHRAEPFFLYLAYNAPHTPLQVPEEELAQMSALGQFNDAVSRIHAMVARMDRGISRLLEELERQGIAENTLVLFTSDNGPMFTGQGDKDTTRFNSGFRGAKYRVYEGGIRVPAVVRWPAGLPADATVSDVVHFADWFPTFTQLAGVPVPGSLALDGQDALPRVRGARDGGVGHPRFWQWNRYSPIARCNAAMREGPWKLVFPTIPGADALDPRDAQLRHALDRGEVAYPDIVIPPEPDRGGLVPLAPQLFHVEADSLETDDRAAAEPARVARMAAAVDAWFAEVEAERKTIADSTRGPGRVAATVRGG